MRVESFINFRRNRIVFGADGVVRGKGCVFVEDWGLVGTGRTVRIVWGTNCAIIGRNLVDFWRNLIIFGSVDSQVGVGGGAGGAVREKGRGVVVEDWGLVWAVTIDWGARCAVIGQNGSLSSGT